MLFVIIFSMQKSIIYSVAIIVAVLAAQAAPVIDNTPTRVQTTLNPALPLKGCLVPKDVSRVSSSRWSVDVAGTDREHASYVAVREYLPPLGIRRLRTQAGWARCEKEKGMYDFRWLDQIVFDAAKRNLEVWLETSYGNPIYKGGGGRGLAGGMPTSEEALAAWDKWVRALAKHYKGYVRDWCVWNEPDLRGANSISEIIPFTIRTAEIIKSEIPDARIAACALTWANVEFIRPFCTALKASGKDGLFKWIAYHHYNYNPDDGYDAEIAAMRKVVKKLTPSLELWQNESGTQSEWCKAGAINNRPWTELKQAKWNLRRYIADLGLGDYTGVFHACDLEYVNSGFHDGLVRYGLIKTAGQADDYRVLKVKMAYYAVQNAVSVFNDALEPLPKDKGGATISGEGRTAFYVFRDRASGSLVPVFWNSSKEPSDLNNVSKVTVSVPARPFKSPVWVDVLTGNVYAIAEENVSVKDGKTIYSSLPCYDSPSFICEEAMIEYAVPEVVKYAHKEAL